MVEISYHQSLDLNKVLWCHNCHMQASPLSLVLILVTVMQRCQPILMKMSEIALLNA